VGRLSAFEGLELYDGKLSRTVLRGRRAVRPLATRYVSWHGSMNNFKTICVGLLIFLAISGFISYFMKASFVLAPILSTVLLAIIGIIRIPEEYDNPEGKGVHPYAFLVIMSGIILVCVAVWYIFPITSNHGLYNVF